MNWKFEILNDEHLQDLLMDPNVSNQFYHSSFVFPTPGQLRFADRPQLYQQAVPFKLLPVEMQSFKVVFKDSLRSRTLVSIANCGFDISRHFMIHHLSSTHKSWALGLKNWCFYSCLMGGFTYPPWFLHKNHTSEKQINHQKFLTKQTVGKHDSKQHNLRKFMTWMRSSWHNFPSSNKFRGTIFLQGFLLTQYLTTPATFNHGLPSVVQWCTRDLGGSHLEPFNRGHVTELPIWGIKQMHMYGNFE